MRKVIADYREVFVRERDVEQKALAAAGEER